MSDIIIYKTQPQKVVSLRVVDSIFNQDPHWDMVAKFIKTKKLIQIGADIILFHYDPNEILDPEWADYEIAIPVYGQVKDEENIKIRELSSNLVASIIHRGKFDNIDKSYNKLLAFIKKKGYKTVGPAIEVRYRSWRNTDDVKNYITEIQFPIFKENEVC